ncbi:MAG TPA: hypothetical protein VMW86_00455, partial [Dehalococcoidales bacterium]|nr:hypothetical protein [Dehalococcoidales bacterium]
IDAEMWPFKWTVIIAIVCVVFGLGLIILGEPPVILFRFIICGALWSFLYLLWEIYELVKYLATHAKARSKQIQIDNEGKHE